MSLDETIAIPERSNVLLVDDRKDNLMLLEEILQPLGQRLVSVQSGDAALAALLEHDFAVILIDVRMPGMDGFETVARIKAREKSRHIPVIFLTAATDDMSVALRGYSEGAVDYLTKPFPPEVLLSKVGVFVALDYNIRLQQRQAELLAASNAELKEMAEAAKAASTAKTAFLNMVGHELRTPLTVLNGYAGLLTAGRYGELPEEMVAPIKILETKSEELTELVDMLLTAAQLEAGTLSSVADMFDVNEIVDEAVERVRPRADMVGAEVILDPSPQTLICIFDRKHVSRVLDNLLNNAITYSEGNPWLRVGVEADGANCTITVEDRGIGIPSELHETIFDRFVRGSAAGIGPPGSGLGLYIARELLQREGGKLELVESESGKGSRFRISLPRAKSGETGLIGNPALTEAIGS